MSLALVATTGVSGNTIAAKTARTAQKVKDGASVKDIAGEAKDKFVNNAKTAGKIAGVAAITGGTGALATAEILTEGGVSAKLPAFAKKLINKAGNSNFAKNFGEIAEQVYTMAGGMIKAHPLLCAATAVIGTVGSVLIGKAIVDNAKTEGKIEQKYDDKLALKNNAAAALEVEA